MGLKSDALVAPSPFGITVMYEPFYTWQTNFSFLKFFAKLIQIKTYYGPGSLKSLC